MGFFERLRERMMARDFDRQVTQQVYLLGTPATVCVAKLPWGKGRLLMRAM